jgi:hydrogenase-4 component F
MIWALLLVPAVGGVLAFLIRPNGPRRAMLVMAAMVHAGLVGWAWCGAWDSPHLPESAGGSMAPMGAVPFSAGGGWMAIDETSLLFLTITSALFLMASIYGVGYLSHEGRDVKRDFEEGLPFSNYAEAEFVGCLLFFLATMTLVIVSRHLGLMWVAVEATTLASAPLVYFHRHHRSLEATWKYLMICSVGIALALLGNFFLAVAADRAGAVSVSLMIDDLMTHAQSLEPVWLKAAFLLFLVGYGTKMGLAPLHTWLPDAHSEAPSVVSALLSGALLNCAFLTILRVHAVLTAADMGSFSRDLLVLFGLISMGMAAVFIIGQADFKRMLAYSSVEHMGILALGIGVGGIATFGSMYHAVNHSLTKGMLFLVAGNILGAYQTKSTADARGVLARLPVTGILWLAGFLAITGSPPFGSFASELTILKGMIDARATVVAIIYLAAMAVIFVGMATIVVRMAYGRAEGNHTSSPSEGTGPSREPLWSVVPPAVLGLGTLVLGVYVPPQLYTLLQHAAEAVGGK